MKLANFDAILDPAARREAQLFSAGMLAGANLAGAILHGLVFKGIFTKEAARALLDEARAATSKIPVPPGYANAIDQLYDQLKSGF